MSNIAIKGNASGSGTTTFQSANTGSSVTFTLPGTDGTNGQAITTDGSGNLGFSNVGISTGKSIAMAMIFGF
jgi:hypothetical protein